MTHALNMIPRHDGSFLRAVADRLMAFYAEVQKELDRRRRADEIYTQLASRSDRALATWGCRARILNGSPARRLVPVKPGHPLIQRLNILIPALPGSPCEGRAFAFPHASPNPQGCAVNGQHSVNAPDLSHKVYKSI